MTTHRAASPAAAPTRDVQGHCAQCTAAEESTSDAAGPAPKCPPRATAAPRAIASQTPRRASDPGSVTPRGECHFEKVPCRAARRREKDLQAGGPKDRHHHSRREAEQLSHRQVQKQQKTCRRSNSTPNSGASDRRNRSWPGARSAGARGARAQAGAPEKRGKGEGRRKRSESRGARTARARHGAGALRSGGPRHAKQVASSAFGGACARAPVEHTPAVKHAGVTAARRACSSESRRLARPAPPGEHLGTQRPQPRSAATAPKSQEKGQGNQLMPRGIARSPQEPVPCTRKPRAKYRPKD